MAQFTVQGAFGTTQTVPFVAPATGAFGSQIAALISAAINSGKYFAPGPNTSTSVPTGYTGAEFINTLSNTAFTLPALYNAIIQNGDPVTINASTAQASPFALAFGTGGTTFYSGNNVVGGQAAIGGGTNLLAASPTGGPGGGPLGLQGSWTIAAGTGSTTDGTSNTIYIGSSVAGGQDSINISGNWTISQGGGNVITTQTALGTGTYFFGGGTETLLGGLGGGIRDIAIASSSGANFLQGGSLGNDTLVGPVAAGVNTLVGGGSGDVLFSSANPSGNSYGTLFFAGAGLETLQGGASSANQTLYGGTSFASGIAPNDVISGGKGNDIIVAGAGSDTIYGGGGADSVWFVASVTGSHLTAGFSGITDIIQDFDIKTDKVLLTGYSSSSIDTVTSGTYKGDARLLLSDGTQVIFNSVKTLPATDIIK